MQNREDAKKKKDDLVNMFKNCVDECKCAGRSSCVKDFKQCPICSTVLKSQCGKKSCDRDGKKPVMIKEVTFRGIRQSKRNLFKTISSPEESDAGIEFEVTDDESIIDEGWEQYMEEMMADADNEAGPSFRQ